MRKLSIGIIETIGLTTAIEAADSMLKAANVQLLGYEVTKGSGLVTVKVGGDVGAVKAAVAAGEISAGKIGRVHGKLLLARPAEGIEILLRNQRDDSKEVQAEVQPLVPSVTLEQNPNSEEQELCNICHDSNCARKKGEPRSMCLHYGTGKE